MADDDTCALKSWAASGAMALTGRRDGPPLGPPGLLVARLDGLRADLAALVGLELDTAALLGERAAIAGLHRSGEVSCGGATRLLPSADGWVALSLARPDDVDAVPALVEGLPAEDPWEAVTASAATRSGASFVERARLLGLPAAGLPPPARTPPDAVAPRRRVDGAPAPPRRLDGARVVDLSSLWAGPLCGSLLAAAGADVVKVESTRRPDGAREGPPRFFDLMNGGKRSVALDLTTSEGTQVLGRLLATADVVIEASRPRALQQLGLDADRLTSTGPQVWVSITGHGRAEPGAGWVGFGDDASVAGGLVARDGAGPVFCADAVADPLAGLVATRAALEALAAGGRWVVDVALSRVAAWAAGPTSPVPVAVPAAPPRARPVAWPGPALGEHTRAVLASLPP